MTEDFFAPRGITPKNAARAREARRAVTRHGFEIPQSWLNAEAAFAEATRLLRQPPPPYPGIPAELKKISGSISAHGKALAQWRADHDAAEEVVAYADQTLGIELARVVTDWTTALAEQFAVAAEAFSGITVTALSGYEDDEQMREFAHKKRLSQEMSGLWTERVMLGAAIGEGDPGKTLWSVCAPPARETEPELLTRWAELEYAWSTSLGEMDAFDRWQRLLDRKVTFSLAQHPGHEQDRLDHWATVRGSAAGQPMLTALGTEQRNTERALLPVASQ